MTPPGQRAAQLSSVLTCVPPSTGTLVDASADEHHTAGTQQHRWWLPAHLAAALWLGSG
jgi:hypothetical protein